MAFDPNALAFYATAGFINDTFPPMKIGSYKTNDDWAAVSGTNYFLIGYSRLNVGDKIDIACDLDGTPQLRTVMFTTVSSTSVVIAQVNNS